MKENLRNVGEMPEQNIGVKSNIELVINRGETKEIGDLPHKSIALDGYVRGPTIDANNEKYSFDHHDGCIRGVTDATCQQVENAILLGLKPNGFKVFVNDVDGDTALSVWLLKNPNRASEPKVRQLVQVVGDIDAFGPAYPVTDKQLMEAFYNGAMKPEDEARSTGKYREIDLAGLLDECVKNIDILVNNELETSLVEEDKRSFEITHQGNDWIMAKSNDFVFDLFYKEGINKAVTYRELADGSVSYIVGKKSDFVSNFPVRSILDKLNEIEPGWGGGSTIGGSPRNTDGSSSKLTPDEVFEVIKGLIEGEKTKDDKEIMDRVIKAFERADLIRDFTDSAFQFDNFRAAPSTDLVETANAELVSTYAELDAVSGIKISEEDIFDVAQGRWLMHYGITNFSAPTIPMDDATLVEIAYGRYQWPDDEK